MKIYTLQKVLKKDIYDACFNYIKLIKDDLKGEKIYGFNLYGYGGFSEGIYVAVATKASLLESIKENKKAKLEFQCPDIYLEICADEWHYIGFHSQVFTSISELLIELFDTLYDDCKFEDETDYQKAEDHINKILPEVIIEVLIALKKNGVFNNEIFEEDVLLGYHFADSGDEQVEKLVQASKIFNSLNWHEKILNYQQYCLSQDG